MGKLILNGVEYINNRIDGYPPLIYSTEEREIGVWTDGKPLYEKCYNITLANGTIGTIDSTFIPKKFNVYMYFSGNDTGDCQSNSFVYDGSNLWTVWIDNRTISGKMHSVYAGKSAVLILQYTKTTDTPGSGKWSPSGLPAKHYSTTERVIGTWIDGKPIYEKVITGLSISLSWNNQYRAENTFTNAPTDIDSLIYIEGYGVSNGDKKSHFSITTYDYGNGSWLLFSLEAGTVNTLIIQYTKTTD